MKRLHLKIHGRVQGVFFRAGTQAQGERLGLSGWVRNTSDGGVEVVAEGPHEILEIFLAWCQHGPPAAQVENVESSWSMGSGDFSGFNIRRGN